MSGAHIVEEGQNNSKKRKNVEHGSNQPKKKFKGKCFNCGKVGHKSTDCRAPKKGKKKDQANLIESNKDYDDLCAMFTECNMVGNPRAWWMDSGATRYVCASKEFFSTYAPAQAEETIYMANSATAKVEEIGKVCLKMTSRKVLTLNNELYVPELRRNLISVSLLGKNGFKCVTVSGKIVVSKGEMYVGKGYLEEGLYKMNVMTVEMNKHSNSSYLLESYNLWHERLGHVNYKTLLKLINLEILPNFECNKSKCQMCVESKYAKHPFKSVERNSNPLELIRTDICDMKSTSSRGGKKYFITFIDHCTRYCYVYLLNSKDEAIDAFSQYKTEVENQLEKRIKMIRSDRGGEYESPFAQICVENGIIHQTTADQTTALYSPQSNGIAERKNRTLKERMNALLISSGLPQNLWGEAIRTANCILNRVPHTKTQSIPYGKWKGRKPNLKYFKVWGCLAKVQVPIPKRVKIGPKTVDCVFIGYAKSSKACRILVHKSEHSDINENTIIESHNAKFFENIYPYKTRHERSSGGSKRPRDEPSENVHNEENPRRSTCQRTSTSFGSDFVTFLLENEPRTFKEAMSSSDSSFWKEAVDSEIDSILSNHMWELVDLPPENKPLGSKWIFKRKMKTDGTIDKYKARLVVKGFNQKEGLDYFDTYSPVTRITSIRMLIALAAVYDLQIHQMDVKTAFLNGELEEEIYMEQPEGFVVPGKENKTPLDANFALRKNEGESDSQLEYTRVLGCLMYIINCTRPDIACTISKLSRYTSNPNKTHWMAMKRVLGYLKYTQDYALHYNKYPAVLEGYSDANWITGSNEVKSTSGYVFTIGGGAVSWKSSKQTCIARSTMESEFIALDKAGEEAEWLRNFLEDIPYWPKPVAPVCIHCDSQAAIGANSVSRFFVAACSLPFDYVKTQIQKMQPDAEGKLPYLGSFDCAMKTLKAGGPFKFYTGFSVYCVRIAPHVMLTWNFLNQIQKVEKKIGL
ncbi:hypothetical protein CQW23_31044 [Capsicum baccatum]|uniref:Retrovirus-related Pol polyprotein from transposon TNT 1-94 n=1 Tax=Capsicum baccatum TaxID=33114 RepID=A0A2G2V8S1_CAPBA|nr:hypothetical protein CQW23_31044 [Capsicum baccatum]